jgi:aspartyl-tRNA(Asn)/glutamyl-tRNA(Gln) amidotransferase subunit C
MITVTDIEKLATLARLKVDDAEKAQLVKEIDSILAYVDTIKKVNIDSGAPEGRVGAVKNVTRSDVARPASIEATQIRDAIVDEVPERIGDLVAVKKIL